MLFGVSIQDAGPFPPAHLDLAGAVDAAVEATRMGWYALVYGPSGTIVDERHPRVRTGDYVVNCRSQEGAVCCRAFHTRAKANAFARWARSRFQAVLLERVPGDKGR